MNTPRDNNRHTVVMGVLNTDGSTPKPICVVDSTHRLCVSDGTTGSNLSSENARRDDNRVPVMIGVSSADGVTPVMVYADSDGKLLIDST